MLKKLAIISPPQQLYPVFHAVLGWIDRLGWVPTGVTTYLGHPFEYPLDSGIGRQIASGEEWDANLGSIITALLPQDEPIFCEVGSNIGASLLQIKRVKPLAYILSFEPSDRFRPLLERNLEQASISRVEISSLLVGSHPGSVWLYNNNSSASVCLNFSSGPHGPRKGPRRKQHATMITLDEMLQHRPHVDFIKVDTDGFDFEVLRGAKHTLKRDSPILYFELFPAASSAATPVADLAWLQSIGYRRFVCFTPSGDLLGVTDMPEQAASWAYSHPYCDILVCHQGSPPEAGIEDLVLQLRKPIKRKFL